MTTFKALIGNAGNGDPLFLQEFPRGTQFESGQLLYLKEGTYLIQEIEPAGHDINDEDYILDIWCYFQGA